MSLQIEYIQIENYRCFHKTEISNFRLVNLIGGKNNVGKTSLLEALYLGCDGYSAYHSIQEWREEKESYRNFFYNTKSDNPIKIAISKDKVITIRRENNHRELSIDNYTSPLNNHFISSRNNVLSNYTLTELYSQARKVDDNNIPTLLDGFQQIDKGFQLIEIVLEDNRSPILYAKKNNELSRPLKSYGDAMNRMAEFILRIVSTPNSVLLIDEVENGIHYQTQEKIWEIIFTLAVKHNVQVFATTHSLEMIKSFTKVAKHFEEHAAYFEMYRNQRNQEIGAIFHDVAALEYELSNHLEIRGGSIA